MWLSALHMDLRNTMSKALYTTCSHVWSALRNVIVIFAPNSLPFIFSLSLCILVLIRCLALPSLDWQRMHNHSSSSVSNTWDWHKVLWFLTFSLAHTVGFSLQRLRQLHLIRTIQWGRERLMNHGGGSEMGETVRLRIRSCSDTVLDWTLVEMSESEQKIECVFENLKSEEREREQKLGSVHVLNWET